MRRRADNLNAKRKSRRRALMRSARMVSDQLTPPTMLKTKASRVPDAALFIDRSNNFLAIPA
jgi:hypothetical protein